MPRTPAYRRRTGSTQAIVTLTDTMTKQRRDYWLGPYGSPESRNHYHCLLAAWESHGRRLPTGTLDRRRAGAPGSITVVEIARHYWRWAASYYEVRRAGQIWRGWSRSCGRPDDVPPEAGQSKAIYFSPSDLAWFDRNS